MVELVVLSLGAVGLGLDIAGSWAEVARRCMPDARKAGQGTDPPDRWEGLGPAMAAILSLHLAVEQADLVVRGAPWLGVTPPLPPADLVRLLRRTERFRDTLMHFQGQASRPRPEATPGGTSRDAPQGSVGLGLSFEHGGAALFAPIKMSTRRTMTRISWDEAEEAVEAIHAWALDLMTRWADVMPLYAPFVEEYRIS